MARSSILNTTKNLNGKNPQQLIPVASAIELWHCGVRQSLMAQPDNFAKCACQHCGGHIEFPIQGLGQRISCPHCGEKTLLSRAAPVEISVGRATRKKIYTALALAVCLAAAAAGFYLYVLSRNSQETAAIPTGPAETSNANLGASAPPPPPAPKPKPPPDLWHGLKASKVSLDTSGNGSLIYAIGTLTNDTTRQRFGVKVELDVLDAHRNKLGSATDYTDVIEPGKEWKFRAMVTDKNAKTAKLTSVKEQE
jgi:hypothetical protein